MKSFTKCSKDVSQTSPRTPLYPPHCRCKTQGTESKEAAHVTWFLHSDMMCEPLGQTRQLNSVAYTELRLLCGTWGAEASLWLSRSEMHHPGSTVWRLRHPLVFSTSSIPWEANILKEMNITFWLSTLFYIEQPNLHIKNNTTIESFNMLLSKIKKKITFPK